MEIFDSLSDVIEKIPVRGRTWKPKNVKFNFEFTGTELAEIALNADLKRIDFSGSIFCENVNFSRIDDFYQCSLSFHQCTFLDNAIFNRCVFENVNFEKTLFMKAASFIKTKFTGKTSFFHAEFKGIALFRAAHFDLDAVFIDTKFEGSTAFDGIETQRLSFENCKILSCIEFKFDHPDDPLHFQALSLKNTHISGKIDLDWEKDCVYQLLRDGNPCSEDLIKQLAILKENYHSQGDYATEDSIYITLMKEKQSVHRKNKRFFRFFALWFMNLISRYGTNPFRILVTILASICLFGFVYFLAIPKVPFIDIVIYSLHGFVTPLRNISVLVSIVSVIETIWGLLLIAYFSATIIRKTIR